MRSHKKSSPLNIPLFFSYARKALLFAFVFLNPQVVEAKSEDKNNDLQCAVYRRDFFAESQSCISMFEMPDTEIYSYILSNKDEAAYIHKLFSEDDAENYLPLAKKVLSQSLPEERAALLEKMINKTISEKKPFILEKLMELVEHAQDNYLVDIMTLMSKYKIDGDIAVLKDSFIDFSEQQISAFYNAFKLAIDKGANVNTQVRRGAFGTVGLLTTSLSLEMGNNFSLLLIKKGAEINELKDNSDLDNMKIISPFVLAIKNRNLAVFEALSSGNIDYKKHYPYPLSSGDIIFHNLASLVDNTFARATQYDSSKEMYEFVKNFLASTKTQKLIKNISKQNPEFVSYLRDYLAKSKPIDWSFIRKLTLGIGYSMLLVDALHNLHRKRQILLTQNMEELNRKTAEELREQQKAQLKEKKKTYKEKIKAEQDKERKLSATSNPNEESKLQINKSEENINELKQEKQPRTNKTNKKLEKENAIKLKKQQEAEEKLRKKEEEHKQAELAKAQAEERRKQRLEEKKAEKERKLLNEINYPTPSSSAEEQKHQKVTIAFVPEEYKPSEITTVHDAKPETLPAGSEEQDKLRQKYIAETCKHVIFIKRILDAGAGLEPTLQHYALLYNIFRCFELLRVYQEMGGITTRFDSLYTKDLRLMIRHYGIATESAKKEVIDFAKGLKGTLTSELLELTHHNLLEKKINRNTRKALCKEFGLINEHDIHFQMENILFAVEDSELFKKLAAFVKRQNGTEEKSISDYRIEDSQKIETEIMPLIEKMINAFKKMTITERNNDPKKFIDYYLLQLQALRFMLMISAEYRHFFKENSPALFEFLIKQQDVAVSVAHALKDLENPVDFANKLQISFDLFTNKKDRKPSLNINATPFVPVSSVPQTLFANAGVSASNVAIEIKENNLNLR